MITRQLREPLSGTVEVGPAIADVGHKGFCTHDEGRRDRCSHERPGELLVTLVDESVSPLHAMPEQFAPRGTISLPRPHLWEDMIHNGLDSQVARLLAVHVPSYTICDHKQAKGLPRGSNRAQGGEHTIFVGFAPPLFARVEPDSCRELDGKIGGEKRRMLA